MKCLETIFIVLLICKHAISFYTLDSSIIPLIQSREILEDKTIVSINSLLNNNTINDINIASLMSNYSNTVYTILQCKYADVIVDLLQTFFEIYEYGRKIVEADKQIANNVINLLISTTEKFYNIKSPVAKMLNNLFSLSDEYPELKTSEPSLLISLLTLQFFLYNRKKDPLIVYNNDTMIPEMEKVDINKYETLKNLKIRNTSIVQIIGLVEIFRHKQCVIHNPYKKNEEIRQQFTSDEMTSEKILISILDPTLDIINSLVNNESDNYEDVNNTIYDPENIFFENIITEKFIFLKDIKFYWNSQVFDLKYLYENVESNFNIKNVLELQNTFIRLIAIIFNTQIYNLLTSASNDKSIRYNVLRSFQLFIDKINLNNVLINISNIIIVPVLSIERAFEKYDNSNDSNSLKPIIEKFEYQINNMRIFEETQENIEDIASLAMSFVNTIIEKQFIEFSRIFNLLSYNYYTKRIIYNIKEYNNVDNEDVQDNPLFMNTIFEFQRCLFTFRILLEKNILQQINPEKFNEFSDNLPAPVSSPSSSSDGTLDVEHSEQSHNIHCSELVLYGKDFGYTLSIVVTTYHIMKYFPDVQNMLIPLLIRFKYTDEHLCQKNMYELVTLHQNIFLTITLLENYILGLFSLSSCKYSSEIFTEHFTNDAQDFDVNRLRNYLFTAVDHTKFIENLDFIIDLYDANIPSTFLLEEYKEIQMYWNGNKQYGYEVSRNLPKMVIDYGDIIGFQLFAAKWLLADILLKIFNALLLANDDNRQGHPDIINKININIKLNELDEISETKLPISTRALLVNTIEVARTMIDIESINDNTESIEHCRQLINGNFEVLGVHTRINYILYNKDNTIDEILNYVTTDIKNLNDVLNVIYSGPLKFFFFRNSDSSSNEPNSELNDELRNLTIDVENDDTQPLLS